MKTNKKILIFFLAITILLTIAAHKCLALKINFIADIHADDKKTRDYSKYSKNNIIFPASYETNLRSVMKEINKKNVSFTIDLGDTSNTGACKYSSLVKKIYKEFDGKVYYVRGNHDNRNCFKKLSRNRYYTINEGGWNIIVLDNSNNGSIDDDQLDWLKKELESNNKSVIIAHISLSLKLQDSISGFSNIKYIITAHTHVGSGSKTVNGIKYITIPALSLKGHQGSYKILSI